MAIYGDAGLALARVPRTHAIAERPLSVRPIDPVVVQARSLSPTPGERDSAVP